MAVTDLGTYYDAMDKAQQNFQILKIREIHKIIKELWQLICKGSGIDKATCWAGWDGG